MLLGHVESPREKGVVDNAGDGRGSLLVFFDEQRQGPGTVCSEGGQEELHVVVCLGEARLVEAIGDGFDRDVGCIDGVGSVVSGGNCGFNAL